MPWSSLLKSSIWLTSFIIRSVLRRMMFRARVSLVSSEEDAPWISVSGVRNSWEMLAKKSMFSMFSFSVISRLMRSASASSFFFRERNQKTEAAASRESATAMLMISPGSRFIRTRTVKGWVPVPLLGPVTQKRTVLKGRLTP